MVCASGQSGHDQNEEMTCEMGEDDGAGCMALAGVGIKPACWMDGIHELCLYRDDGLQNVCRLR